MGFDRNKTETVQAPPTDAGESSGRAGTAYQQSRRKPSRFGTTMERNTHKRHILQEDVLELQRADKEDW